jgi:hypothetical protein
MFGYEKSQSVSWPKSEYHVTLFAFASSEEMWQTNPLLTYIDKMADDVTAQPPTNGATEHIVEDGDDAETQV